MNHLRPRLLLLRALALLASSGCLHAAAEADLLAAYSATYASSVGGDDNAQVIIANAIASTNLINERSGTGASIRVVGYMQSAANNHQTSTLGGYVGWMANRDPRLVDVVDRGVALGADLVTYICAPVTSETAAAVAQQPGMYSSFGPGNFWSAIVAHEIGHNYGRSHSDGKLSPKSVMLHNYCGGGAAPPYLFTNAGIWFNDTHLLGDGNNCSQGGLINGGDNSLPGSVSAQGVADRRERIVASPRLDSVVRRWSFDQPAGFAPAGTTITDQISGTAPAVVRGVGATFTGKGLRVPGGGTGNVAANSIPAYIDLPNGILSSNTSVTIEVWATPLSTRNWGRILDFGRTVQAGDGLGAAGEYTGTPGTGAPGATQSSDSLMLSASVGTNLSAQRFEAKLDGTAINLESGLPTVAGVPHHYVVTFTANGSGGRWQWYRDGDAVAFLDVSYPLSSIEDVNNWLGRSLWSGDDMAHAEYAEVRISNVPLSRDQVLAHYLLGPNHDSTATVALTTSDSIGTTSFNNAGRWDDPAAPSAAKRYQTFGHTLRTPETAASVAFAGQSLAVTGGRLLYKGTASSTVTVSELQLANATVAHAGSGIFSLAGSVSIAPEGATIFGVNGPTTLQANLTGAGPLTFVGQATTLAGTPSGYTGKILVGDGNAGTLVIDSPARLGTSPATPVSDQLTLNRGTLQTTANLALDDPNRGIRIDVSGATFDVAAATSLLLSSPLSSPDQGANIRAGLLRKRGPGTLVLAGATSGFNGGVHVDSGSTFADDGLLRVTSPQPLANARSPFQINNNNGGRSTLQLDGSATPITLSQSIVLAGRTNASPAVQNLAGNNTLGGVSVNVGGAFYILQSDAGSLRFNGPLTAAATGTRTFTLQGAGDFQLNGGVTNGGATVALAKTGTGALLLSSTAAHTGGTAVSAGSLQLAAAGSLPSGNVSIAAAASLSGLGSIAATTAISGILAPGAPNGTQSITGPLTYQSTSRLRWTLVSDSTVLGASGRVAAATVNVASGARLDLTFDSPGSTTNFASAFWTQPRSWSVLSASNQTGGFTLGQISADSLGQSASIAGGFSLAQSASGVSVNWIPSASAVWRAEAFGPQAGDPAVAGFTADPDRDGLPNGLEYFLGSAPTTSTPAAPVAERQPDARLSLSFARRVAATDLTATVQGADSPGGPWTDLARSTGGAPFVVLAEGATVTESGEGDFRSVEVHDAVPADATHPRRFLRLVVSETIP